LVARGVVGASGDGWVRRASAEGGVANQTIHGGHGLNDAIAGSSVLHSSLWRRWGCQGAEVVEAPRVPSSDAGFWLNGKSSLPVSVEGGSRWRKCTRHRF